MKAYRYLGGTDFALQDVPVPNPGRGEALAKVRIATICGTDLRLHRFGNAGLKTPLTIGHEACYEIVEVGEGVDLVIGGRYIMAPAIGCGECKSCRNGKTNMCDRLQTIGFQYDGTFAEYIKIPGKAIEQGHLIEVGSHVSDEVASAVEPIACAINAQSFLDIRPGDHVLIYGAGYLGCVHAELAQTKNAGKIMIAEISEKRRRRITKFVPNAVAVDSGKANYTAAIADIVGGQGVDVVIAACPAGVTHRQGLEILNKSGRMSLFGGLPGETNYHLDSNLIHYKEASIFGAHASTVLQNKEALTLVESGKIDIRKYISIYDMEDIEKAFDALISEDAEKAAIRFAK